MRLGPGQRWVPLDAEEPYSVRPPGFVWAGTARMGPLPVARARDMYAGGEGRLLVKVASLWPVVDASGEQMDQAAMMRYLSDDALPERDDLVPRRLPGRQHLLRAGR